ncbi:MAG: sensor histidine kinase, partial [Nitrososphaeraceae archaeon]
SDLSLVMAVLDGLGNSAYLQNEELSAEKTKNLIEEKYGVVKNIVDRIFVLDKNDIVTIGLSPEGKDRYLGADFSQRTWVQEAKRTLKPVFSEGFERQGIYTTFIAIPIINRENSQYLGLIGASIPTESFFAHYGNVHDINSQFLVALDKKGTLLAVGASKDLVGRNFFGPFVQKFINYNQVLDNLTKNLLSGKPGYAIYDYGRGERINTNYPIFVQGKPNYFIQAVTPTNVIFSNIGETLFAERLKSYSLLVGTLIAVAVLIIFLVKWSSTMEKEVVKRTRELKESNLKLDTMTKDLKNSNISLQEAYQQLKENEKIQKDFINVAAHELRTPIQPILGLSGILHSELRNPSQKEMINIVMRNAKRLQRLSQDILDASKIESGLLKLHKERFDINEKIKTVISDIENGPDVYMKNKDIKIVFEPKESLYVYADKERSYQVIFNLLKNALKFTETGTITITTAMKRDINEDDGEVVVTISDTGKGIDSDVMPRLFSKFVSKSDAGTGLGLFISKNIIEVHGGKMWAQNNSNGVGAIFSFTLPAINFDSTSYTPSDEDFTQN